MFLIKDSQFWINYSSICWRPLGSSWRIPGHLWTPGDWIRERLLTLFSMEDEAKRKDVAQQRPLAPTYGNFSIRHTLVTLHKEVSAWLDSICNTSYSLLGVTEVVCFKSGVKSPTTICRSHDNNSTSQMWHKKWSQTCSCLIVPAWAFSLRPFVRICF